MSIRKEIKPGQTGETRSGSICHLGEDAGGAGIYAPRKLTFTENVVLTIKVLAGFGLLGAAVWGINLWTAPQ